MARALTIPMHGQLFGGRFQKLSRMVFYIPVRDGFRLDSNRAVQNLLPTFSDILVLVFSGHEGWLKDSL